MKKTVYANSAHPKLVKWSCGIAVALGIGMFIAYMLLEANYKHLLYIAAFSLLYSTLFTGQYYLRHYEIDEDAGTVTDFQNRKYPLQISRLTSATYKENRKGKFRSLFLHDDGVGFMDIRTSKEKADQMVAQLQKLNPAIEVKHVHYL